MEKQNDTELAKILKKLASEPQESSAEMMEQYLWLRHEQFDLKRAFEEMETHTSDTIAEAEEMEREIVELQIQASNRQARGQR